MSGLRDQADELRALLRDAAGAVASPAPGSITFESILNAWLDDDGQTAERLREEGLLDLTALVEADPSDLNDLLARQPRGLSPTTILTLRRLAGRLLEQSAGRLEVWADRPTEELRQQLRTIRGLGPTSVDQIALRAFGRPIVPVSRGIYRVAIRHGWLDPTADYDEAQSILGGIAPDDPAALARAVPVLESIAQRYCKAARPRCPQCPLNCLLGPDGPRDLNE